MMHWEQILVILSIALIMFNYVGYPVAIIGLSKIIDVFSGKNEEQNTSESVHFKVTFVVAAYNEERVIENKIANTFALDYPKELLEILIVADGSSDNTKEIVSKYQSKGVRLLHNSERRGKTAALNRAVDAATGEIVVFSDANNDFSKDAIKKLVRHFENPEVGGVCGSKKIKRNDTRESAEGDSLYWRYESAIKRAESAVGSITGADGEIFAIRRALFRKLDERVINDDAEITLGLVQQGYRVLYDTEAESWEEASIDILDDFNVKVRMVAGGFQTISRWPLQTVVPSSWYSVAFLSHKVLRWLVPEFMLIALIGNFFLLEYPFYRVLLLLQIVFYFLAMTGWVLRKKMQLPTYIYVPFYLFTMNVAALVGLLRFLRGRQSTAWKKAQR